MAQMLQPLTHFLRQVKRKVQGQKNKLAGGDGCIEKKAYLCRLFEVKSRKRAREKRRMLATI